MIPIPHHGKFLALSGRLGFSNSVMGVAFFGVTV